jgi:hypothetical protein
MDHIVSLMSRRQDLLALGRDRELTPFEHAELGYVTESLLGVTIGINSTYVPVPREKVTPPKFLPIAHPPKKVERRKRNKRPKTGRRYNKALFQPR